MAVVTLTDSEAWLRDAVGTNALLQGRQLAQEDAVEAVSLDASRVQGSVRCGAATHQVEAVLRLRPDGGLDAVEGWCTCGRAVPCPHAVALLLASAVDGAAPARPRGRRRLAVVHEDRPTLAPAVWEGQLTAVLADPPAPSRSRRSSAVRALPASPPIALQFEFTPDPGRRLAIRPVAPGRNGGWVRSGASWSMMHYADYYFRHVAPGQLRLLRELHGLPSTYAPGYHDKVIYLDQVASRRVWDLLLELQESGMPLVMSGRHAEPVQVLAAPVVARVDLSRADGELMVSPVWEVAERRVPPSAVTLGDPPHGFAWFPAGTTGGLHLARLAAQPHPLFTRLVAADQLRIPAADEPRFLADYYPQLAQHVDVVCRDGSVGLPESRPPVLELSVTGRGGHGVDLEWAWGYQVGSARRQEPLVMPSGPTIRGRDGAAEARILDAVGTLLADQPDVVEQLADGLRPRAQARLDGLATARFLAEVLPRLDDRPDVVVSLTLAPGTPEYRETDASPVISFTADTAGDTLLGFGSQDWFDLAVTVTIDGHDVPFEQLFVALAQGQLELLLDDGLYFRLDREEFAQLARLIAESRELLDAPPATVRLSRYHAGLWDDVERLGAISGQVEGWRAAVRSLTTAADLPQHKVPAGLLADLRPYQEAGFSWLATLYGLRLGGVLADDMGLGKTLQALALMLHAREQGRTDQPFLVVAPTSVVANWASEAKRFAPELAVVTVTQTGTRRGHDLAAAIVGADVVITSYTLFRLEFEEYRSRQWAGLLLDEAQYVKNHQAAGYRCAKELPADFKLAITGTPMENNLMELWSLLSITAPGLFARAERFTEYYRSPIEREHDTERLSQLRRRIRPLLLRRTKEQVAPDLPDRQEQVMELELHPRHRTVYAKYLQRERQKVLGLLGDFSRNRFEIFRSLTLLRQASLDVSLVDPAHASVASTKLDALLDQLTAIVDEGHRVLVFSQFTRFLERARDRLDREGLDYCYLDGKTRNRARVISRFREGTAPVFLISLKAGGSGLNLTEADYVFLLDPWWNPATEAQAVDRAHRIGQTRKVMVYRMVAKDTIEEKVMALKARKAALTSSVLDGDDFATARLTPDDIRALLA